MVATSINTSNLIYYQKEKKDGEVAAALILKSLDIQATRTSMD
jgi:hypothetical protein